MFIAVVYVWSHEPTMLKRGLRHRAPLLWLLLPFMAGLVSAHAGMNRVPLWMHFAAALAVVALATRCWRGRPLAWAAGLVLAAWLLGSAYYQMRRPQLSEWEQMPAREFTGTVRIERMFTPSADARTLGGLAVISKAALRMEETVGHRVSISVIRKFCPEPLLKSGEYEIAGLIEPLSSASDHASFDGFLYSSGANFRITRARLVKMVREPTAFRQFCFRWHHRFSGYLRHGLEDHPDLYAVFAGMVLGETAGLTDEQDELFQNSGTLHLFSVSGLHIAAIAVAIHMTLSLMRLRGWLRVLLCVSILWLYVAITGQSPSAVRAFAMVAFFEFARVLPRPVNPVSTLAASALITLLAEPLQLFGASFQMSYGIVAGLLLLGLPLAEWLQESTAMFSQLPKAAWQWHHHLCDWVRRASVSSLAIGVSTSLVSTVATLLYFGLFTPGAIVANFILIPLSSLALWAGFLSLASGLIGAVAVCSIFNHAAAVTLAAMAWCIRAVVAVPGTHVKGEFHSSFVGFVSLGALLASLLYGYSTAWDLRRGGWLPPFAVLGAALAFGVKW